MRTASAGLLPASVCAALLVLAPGFAFGQQQERPVDDRPLYQRIETPPAPVLSVEQALEAFRIAPGFRIEAVATEPLVEDPIAFTWDEAGNLYVTEMRAYMRDTEGTDQEEPIGTVVRLKDTNGDGVFDEREVMLDALVLPRAVAIVNEGLLIAEPPNLWLCPSTTGRAADINCNSKRKVDTYGDQPGSVEHAENGLLQGLDNWLYSAKSNRRLQIQNGEMVSQPTLFRGQWGIAKDNSGRLFYNTNSNLLSGDLYSAQSLVAAGSTAAAGLNERISKDDALYAIRVNTGVNRAYVPGVLREDGRLNQPTSASGMAANRTARFGEQHLNDMFVAEPAANAVVRLVLQGAEDRLPRSAEHVRYPDPDWQQREFLASSDERFRPVSVGFGPDGALYVADFYRGIIQDHVFISEQLRTQVQERKLARPPGMGRIWRIVPESADRELEAAENAAVLDLGAANDAELVLALGHSNGWHRDTAQRLLLVRAGKGVKQLLLTALETGSKWQQVHALWTLEGRGELSRAAALAAARSDNGELARQALAAGAGLLRANDALALLKRRVEDERYQQAAIDLLARHNQKRKVRLTLLELMLTRTDNPYAMAGLRAASRGQEAEILLALRPESSATHIEPLAAQMLNSALSQNSAQVALLDGLDAATDADMDWSRAILRGLYAATRVTGFERVVLPKPHRLFASDSARELWPAIARARLAFTWPNDELPPQLPPLTAEQKRRSALGASYFAERCATCHGTDGAGITGLAPALVDSPWVTTNTERLVRVVLHGLQGEIEVNEASWNGVMPGHAGVPEFTDEVASGLVTYLHRAWGHSGRPIEPEFVAEIRETTRERLFPWMADELALLNSNTHFRDYEGAYGTGFVLSFTYNGHGLDIATGIFNGPLDFVREDHFEFAPRKIRFEFERDDAGIVQALWMQGAEGPARRVAKK